MSHQITLYGFGGTRSARCQWTLQELGADFEFIEKSPARLAGFGRRFWQGSHDHRGLPESPGRVVTLIQNADEYCDGIAYLLDADVVRQTFEMLDHREKNGYDKFAVSLRLVDDRQVVVRTLRNVALVGRAAAIGDRQCRSIIACTNTVVVGHKNAHEIPRKPATGVLSSV